MIKNALTVTLFAVMVIFGSPVAFGDVAPDPGFERVAIDLKIETNDDLPDYRFFIRSGSKVEEVSLRKGEITAIRTLGGGAFYSSGKLLAVPASELKNLGNDVRPDRLTEMEQAVFDGRIPGTIELVDHLFSRTVPKAEAQNYSDPLYRIERDPQAGVKAVHVSGGANSSVPTSVASSGLRFWQSAAAAIVAGIFLVFGVAILGIMYFKKKAKVL